MIWRFTIIQGIKETKISEPHFWDTAEKTIQRDPERHGVVFNFSTSTLEFSDEAYWIIKEEYLVRGVDGDIGLRIEWLCDDKYELFYFGKLDFARYEEKCGFDCSVIIGLEESSADVLIKNRMETSVDLTSGVGYDNESILANYSGLT